MKTSTKALPSKEHVEHMAKLDKAIYMQVCAYCGALPGQRCISKSKSPNMPNGTSPIPHIVRTRAGNRAMRATP